MTDEVDLPARVSVVIPTYNRAADVRIAVASALGQTYPAAALAIIVVDDGGIDDTAQVVRREFGERVRHVRTTNRGVSAARNHGLALATGTHLGLLDDDDEWHPTKIAAQSRLLSERPDIGMVLTDVERTDAHRSTVEIFHRRTQFPADGHVIAHAVRRPSFIPSSAIFRREVLAATGGFDASLTSAEDIDFLLRVAVRFGIAVIAEPLTRAMHAPGPSSSIRSFDPRAPPRGGAVSGFGGSPHRLEIGLGDATRITRLEIRWPRTSEPQVFTDVPLDAWLSVREGEAAFERLKRESIRF